LAYELTAELAAFAFAVVVDDQTRHAVRLAEYQTDRVGIAHPLATMRDGRRHAALDQRMVDRLVLVEGPHAGAGLRFGAVGAAREKAPVGRADGHGRIRFAAPGNGIDARGIDPRMAPEQGLLLARLERNHIHYSTTLTIGCEVSAR